MESNLVICRGLPLAKNSAFSYDDKHQLHLIFFIGAGWMLESLFDKTL